MRAVAILLLHVLLLASRTAEARCEAQPRFLTLEYLHRWEIIAFGRVIKTHDDASARYESFATLILEGSWQGDPPNPLTVYHSDSAHGYQFTEGSSYLVFASRDAGGRIEASICSPTCRGSDCLPQRNLLGEPTARF
ncbi:MAG: hypothetical protein KC492_11560 [Myxococcales bacterium]|nr:hypothetical protein [Myxococcales bacterium]